MSPFSSSFPPQPRVYSRNQLLLPASASRGANISPFSARCAYFPSQRGLVYPLRHLITLSFEGCSGLSDLCAALFPVSECSTPLLPITSLQPQQFHAITHSFAQRRAAIPPIFNGFRTLSIATRVYYPPPTFLSGPRRLSASVANPMFSETCSLFVVSSRSFPRSLPLSSILCSLFCENTRVGGLPHLECNLRDKLSVSPQSLPLWSVCLCGKSHPSRSLKPERAGTRLRSPAGSIRRPSASPQSGCARRASSCE